MQGLAERLSQGLVILRRGLGLSQGLTEGLAQGLRFFFKVKLCSGGQVIVNI